jgi:hypothetical protein
MSTILKGNILSVGQLEEQIFQAMNSFGCTEPPKEPNKLPEDPCEIQRLMAKRLANAISDAVSKGVQQYLTQAVKTVNESTLEGGGGNETQHIHPNVPQYNLTAP